MKVTFHSPGTFVPESTTLETDLTDPMQIAELARGITERHGSRPACFQMETQPGVTYWLGGKIMTYDEIPDTEDNRILRANVRINRIERVIMNTNSWQTTAEFRANDVLLDFVL